MIRFVLFAIYLLTLLFSLSAQAGLRLFEWTADTTLAPLILPVKENETPEIAAERYLKNLESNPDLMELFAGRRPYLPNSEFKAMAEDGAEKQVLLIANLPKDYTRDSLRITNFMKLFARSEHRSVILPVAANIGLTIGESQEFFGLIREKFQLLVAMGGDDVDPAKYRKENLHSRNIVPTRDRFEIQLIKNYVAAAKGFLLGVCRGAQISAVALGYELHQHVPFHIGTEVAHANDWHEVVVEKTASGMLLPLADAQGRLSVNSLHHQSVRFRKGGSLQIAARATDGTTEALEFKNGKGLLLQFHPELMDNLLGAQIIDRVIAQKDRTLAGSCRKIFR